jgi:acetyl esterase/lipase
LNRHRRDTIDVNKRQEVNSQIHHPLEKSDGETVAAIVTFLQQNGGQFDWLDNAIARRAFDDMMRQVSSAAGITYENAAVGGVPGIWARPANAPARKALVHFHGGGYSLGSAAAYQTFAGNIAARAGISSFVPDYRLAPEHPHPAAFEDASAAYAGLCQLGMESIALVGDSAGGGLALALLAHLQNESDAGRGQAPAAAAVISPWIDLALNGASVSTLAQDDPLVSKAVAEVWAARYLAGESPTHPTASPIHGRLNGLPPVSIHIGSREILLDDARAYAQRARAAGSPVEMHVWEGMLHVFPSSVGTLKAADASLELIAAFLRAHCGLSQTR